MNERLMAPFTAEEVKKALFAIGDFKASRTDGMHAIFFLKNLALNWRFGNKRGFGGFEFECDARGVERDNDCADTQSK
jgi:hypothetical protein